MMLEASVGILRTQPDAVAERSFERLRLAAARARRGVAGRGAVPGVRAPPGPDDPAHAAIMHEASRIGSGAGYTAFDGALPELTTHWAVAAPYAHATAPLRRLQDRYVSDCCLGQPDRRRCRTCPRRWPPRVAPRGRRRPRRRRPRRGRHASGREGERFDAIVIDDNVIQLRDPAVRAKVSGSPAPGTAVERAAGARRPRDAHRQLRALERADVRDAVALEQREQVGEDPLHQPRAVVDEAGVELDGGRAELSFV